MPCDSSYMNPTGKEKELQKTAKLLIFVYQKLGIQIPDWLQKDADDIYCKNDQAVIDLCAALRGLSADQIERIVYDPHSKQARQLADWWDEHQEADKRKEQELMDKERRVNLQKQAIAKLTPDERKALGV